MSQIKGEKRERERELVNLYNKVILLNDGHNNSGSKIITGIQLDEPWTLAEEDYWTCSMISYREEMLYICIRNFNNYVCISFLYQAALIFSKMTQGIHSQIPSKFSKRYTGQLTFPSKMILHSSRRISESTLPFCNSIFLVLCPVARASIKPAMKILYLRKYQKKGREKIN